MITFTILFSVLMLAKISKYVKVSIYSLLLIILSVLDHANNGFWVGSGLFNLDFLSYWLVMMVMAAMKLSILAFLNWELDLKLYKLFLLTNFLTLMVCLMFMSSSLIVIYFTFEVSVIPIFLIILGWGYQPERLSASVAMFFYTAFCSVPLLVMILIIQEMYGTLNWVYHFCFMENNYGTVFFITTLIILAAFLVKLPMFGFHLWLPKAHVEAPVYGSMILAAVLLKLGGLGVMRVLPFASSFMSSVFASISILSMGAVGVLCVFLFDMKMIVAYSSVAHMALVILTAVVVVKYSVIISTLMMITHAFASSMLFFGVTKIYTQSQSRSILMNTGNLISNPKFALIWMLASMASMATPPLMNFFSEALSFIIIGGVSPMSYLFIVIAVFTGGIYSLILFSSTQHGKINNKFIKTLNFTSLDYMNSVLHIIYFSLTIFILILFFYYNTIYYF